MLLPIRPHHARRSTTTTTPTSPTWTEVLGFSSTVTRTAGLSSKDSFRKDLILSATESTGAEKCLRILEVIVVVRVGLAIAHCGSDDVALAKRWAVMDGDDADLVSRTIDQDRCESVLRLDLIERCVGSLRPLLDLRRGGNKSPLRR